jgi:Rieske Fe-S protein
LSDNQDDVEKKEDNSSSQNSQASTSSSQDSGSNDQQKPKPAAPARPTIGTPINRPKIGTPIGTPAAKSAAQSPAAPVAQQPAKVASVGSPVSRPTIGTPVGSKPTVGTPVGAKPTAAVGTPAPAVSRPVISSPSAGRPTTPAKKPESKQDVSRRNFMKGLVALGGIVAIVQFGPLLPFLQASVGGSVISKQTLTDSITGATVTASTFDDPSHLDWVTFVYPSTGNPNIDSDTFRQCVAIRLPKGFTAPPNLSVTDSSGNVYCGFSRVCVHLWCLWSYVVTDSRMECPCHGSQYVPGSGTYPLLPVADNKPPGLAVQGPASLQTPPNNQLPMIHLGINADGSFYADNIIGQIGCGQQC